MILGGYSWLHIQGSFLASLEEYGVPEIKVPSLGPTFFGVDTLEWSEPCLEAGLLGTF